MNHKWGKEEIERHADGRSMILPRHYQTCEVCGLKVLLSYANRRSSTFTRRMLTGYYNAKIPPCSGKPEAVK